MRVITKKRLNDFVKQYPDAAPALKFWYDTVTENSFYTAQEVIQIFNTADYVGNERIVFNIARNKYRLIAKFKFNPRAQVVYIRFIGTHSEYDKITKIANI
jgi:mRNA interferase HigB